MNLNPFLTVIPADMVVMEEDADEISDWPDLEVESEEEEDEE